MGVPSGVPTTVNGILVGASDFSEFEVAAGLPSGITEFGIGTSSPTAVAIANDPVEGNYFEMTGHAGGQQGYGFGLDSFDNQIIFGEMLCRMYNVGTIFNWSSNGPVWNLAGLVGFPASDMNFIGGALQHQDSGPYRSQTLSYINGSTGVPLSGLMQEAVQVPEWAWIRVRRTANLTSPSLDDWQITSWFGDLDDEPVSVDATVNSLAAARRILGAMGWGVGLAAATEEQRVAYIAFTADPLTEPPPVPSDILPPGTTIWIPEPLPLLPGTVEGPAPKPTDLFRPIVEFDVRKIRSDGMDYANEENIRGDEGGVGWQDLEITDPQGRTDAGILPGFGAGNVLFVKNGWNLKRQIDAVRFVGEPPGAPVLQQTSVAWNGGGNDPQNTHWPGNEYSYIGVMRCTDISEHACLFGGTSGIIPVIGNPFKTSVWVQSDGSVAMHHMDEESFGSSVQPGSSYSLESAPGLVKAGDSVIITVTHSALTGPRTGATMRLNGKEIARNTSATRLLEEMNRPSLGESQPQQAGPGVGVVGGLDRLIVYFAAFGGLLTTQQIAEYERFLAFTFQISIGTEWEFEPPPIIVPGDTPWTAAVDPPVQPVIAEQRIELDSRGPEPLPLVENPVGSGFFGTWPDDSGSTVPGAVTVTGNGSPRPTWEEKGWDPNGRALGVVDFSTLSCRMDVFDGGLGLGYNAGPQGDPQGRRVTVFLVCEATDLTQGHIVLLGGNDNRVRRNLLVAILQDGTVAFDYNDSGGDDNTRTAPGLVAEGDRLQITCRAGDGGRIIRVNGVEVGSSIGTGTLITYPTMMIGNYRFFEGSPMKLAWYSGHNIEVSDTQILEMEAFLQGAFFQAPPAPPTGWS
jgi:hypothetical protein